MSSGFLIARSQSESRYISACWNRTENLQLINLILPHLHKKISLLSNSSRPHNTKKRTLTMTNRLQPQIWLTDLCRPITTCRRGIPAYITARKQNRKHAQMPQHNMSQQGSRKYKERGSLCICILAPIMTEAIRKLWLMVNLVGLRAPIKKQINTVCFVWFWPDWVVFWRMSWLALFFLFCFLFSHSVSLG